MASLSHSLNIGSESLMSNRQGIDTTAHNIANAQTDGYSRQDVNLAQKNPISRNGLVIGDGVYVGSIKRAHDQFIEKQVTKATTKNGYSDKLYDNLQDFQLIFSPELESTVAEEMSGFFGALQSLSSTPDDLTARTVLVDQANNVSASFRRVDNEIKEKRASINDTIAARTQEINDITGQIAKLNVSIQAMELTPSASANDLRDQQDRLVSKLSSIMDVSYYQDKDGMMCLRGPGETLLVDRRFASTMECQINGDDGGMFRLVNTEPGGGKSWDVTDKVKSGEVKALLYVRDDVAKPLLQRNNELASVFIKSVNDIHQQGFGLNQFADSIGRGFFENVRDPANAAAEIEISNLIQSSTDAISVASSPNARGDNVIANELLGLKSKKLMEDGNASFNDYYANFVGVLGTEVVRSSHARDTDKIMLAELKGRKEMISGVSLDEEAANMIKWQTAFTASSKVITTVDEMFDTILNMKR
ncbi:MAG: flagellar hook-associated protein FlgK [Pseudomonadota bacterium]